MNKTCGTCHGLIPGFCQCEHRDRWTMVLGQWVIGAPQWLKDRMKKIKSLPPLTSEEVERQWRGGIEQQLPQWLKIRKTSVGKDSEVR